MTAAHFNDGRASIAQVCAGSYTRKGESSTKSDKFSEAA
jgi:hypothetical protein